ncbi:MAG TPA: MarR family transcriptional regulator [Anaerolineales bacterium]|jgi:DNA-binding MarR family transcriptional regulator|nr:MarR family transcriptional regulator [Anaerolineales bacterium]
MTSTPQLIQTIRQFMDFAMHHSMRERAHFAKATGLSMPQFGILMQLHYRGNCAVGDISERFDITNAAASQLVDKLVQSRLIQREEDPADRRAKLLNLTEKARELIQQGIEERYRWVDQLAAKLTPEERTKVTEALQIMTQAAKELETEPATSVS